MEFVFAKVTNSRLMGSMGLIIKWEDKEKFKLQYFLLDAEGLGIADYVSLVNPSKEEAYMEEERLTGGLGSDKIQLTKEEALFLVHYYGNKNYYYEKELPGEVDEYIDIIDSYKSELTLKDLYPKICKPITSDVEFINYMTMRFIAWDKDSLRYFSGSEEIASMHITNINGTLLKNTVTAVGKNKYISEALYEDNDGYYICKIAFNIEVQDNDYKIKSILVSNKEGVYDFDVFDEISKQEFLAIYSIKEDVEVFIEEFHNKNPFLLRSEMDNRNYSIRFNFDNNHVKEHIYVINNDIKASYYQLGEKFFVGTYSNKDRNYINKLLMCNFKKYLELEEELFFEEHVLHDFIESESDDFNDFLD